MASFVSAWRPNVDRATPTIQASMVIEYLGNARLLATPQACPAHTGPVRITWMIVLSGLRHERVCRKVQVIP